MGRYGPSVRAVLAVLSATALLTHGVWAAPELVSGPRVERSGDALTATGTLAGLDKRPVSIQLAATIPCTRRAGSGGMVAMAMGTTAPLLPQQGRLTFAVTTEPLSAACGHDQLSLIRFNSVTLTVLDARTGDLLLTHPVVAVP
jgi:hypothetical protein